MAHSTPSTSTRDDLISEHMPLVGYAVNAMAVRIPRHVPREDLMSAGMLGLTQAAAAYDESTGVPFTRFAKVRIQGALLDELRSRDWASRSVRRNARKMRAANDAVLAREGRAPTLTESAQEMGVSIDEAQKIVEDVHRGTVLNYESLMVDGPVDDVLPSQDVTPESLVVDRERRGVLLDAVQALPERLRVVITDYFFNERPMAEIAADLGVTESRISQMRAEAFVLIRQAMAMTLEGAEAPAEDRPKGRAARRRAAYYAQVATASSVADRLAAVPDLAVSAA